MEFFEIVDLATDQKTLKAQLTIKRLPDFCVSISKVVKSRGNKGQIYCLWGLFDIHREVINGGVRFTLPTCPNGLAWTITTGSPPAPEAVVIHLTINRTEHDPDFVDSIDEFVTNFKHGLTSNRAFKAPLSKGGLATTIR
jgi:hypothetical protein